MKTADQLIEELNTLDEHTSIEAKTASEIGTSVMEAVCAFSNEPHLGSGYIILGVAPVASSFWTACGVGRYVNLRARGKLQRKSELLREGRTESISVAVTSKIDAQVFAT